MGAFLRTFCPENNLIVIVTGVNVNKMRIKCEHSENNHALLSSPPVRNLKIGLVTDNAIPNRNRDAIKPDDRKRQTLDDKTKTPAQTTEKTTEEDHRTERSPGPRKDHRKTPEKTTAQTPEKTPEIYSRVDKNDLRIDQNRPENFRNWP